MIRPEQDSAKPDGRPSPRERWGDWRRWRRWRRRRRRLPPMSVIPTLFTLANLVCGFAAIHYAVKPHDFKGIGGWSGLTMAGALVFLGMFFDAIDGTIARLTRSTSELGAQLDALADVVTFGVAPAFMMLQLVHVYVTGLADVAIIGPEADSTLGKIIWAAGAVYVSCAALRLARFNVETGPAFQDHLSFRGLPSPGAAGAVASLIILHQHLYADRQGDVTVAFARWAALGIPLVTLLCGIAMVSTIRYVHVVNRYMGGRRSFNYVVMLVVPAVFAIWWFQFVLAVLFTAYALSGPLRWLSHRVRRRSTAAMKPAPPR